MKKIIKLSSLLLVLLAFHLNAQENIQGTIEKVGNIASVSAQAVNTPLMSDTITNMIVLLSIEDVYGPVTATVSVNYINNLSWMSVAPYTISGRKYFLFTGINNTPSTPQTWPLNTPQKIIDVAFTGGNVSPYEAPVRLNDLEHSAGAMTNNIWYVEVGGVDQTNYTAPFFATPNTSLVTTGPPEWFVETSGLVPLPIELTTFTGKWADDKNALLQWSTASEKDLGHFELERAFGENMDYNKVGEVKAAGNSSALKSYSFTDKSVGFERSDLFYYRLRMVEKNGRFTYSPIVSLARTETYSFQVSPNPNNGLFSLLVTSDFEKLENPTYVLTDVAGKAIQNGPVSSSKMQFDMSRSAKGIYFLNINSAGKQVKQYKVVKGEEK